MTIKYGKFKLPTKIKVDEADESGTFARFVAEPFERGYGHTVGNALRRIMLTSLEAPAIISVKIEGVPHEFMAVEGIIEDMTHVILNLKGALLRKHATEDVGPRAPKLITKQFDVTEQMIEKDGGKYIVTAKDLFGETDYDLVNPDHKIFTITKPFSRKIDIKIGIGRGYMPSERHDISSKVADEIILDSIFSPVKLVNYFVENTRVGQDTDFDRLVLEIRTDGRVTPQEALAFATQIGVLHFQCFDELKFQTITFDHKEDEENADRDELISKLCLRINEIELSVRSTNCLSQANIDTIAELVIMPESDMLKFRNFGKKSMNEIKAKLEEMGLHLGMEKELDKLGIKRDNVKQFLSDYMKEKSGIEE